MLGLLCNRKTDDEIRKYRAKQDRYERIEYQNRKPHLGGSDRRRHSSLPPLIEQANYRLWHNRISTMRMIMRHQGISSLCWPGVFS
jgi:hypothetical protein